MPEADLLRRKGLRFTLWLPRAPAIPPVLVFGAFRAGNPPTLEGERRVPLVAVAGIEGLYELDPGMAGLREGQVIHYWFEVADTHPGAERRPVLVTDPLATTVDWRLTSSPFPDGPFGPQPAAVVKFAGSRLVPCDPGGEEPDSGGNASPSSLPANRQLVIYELPTAWSVSDEDGASERGIGTFRDVRALIDLDCLGANYNFDLVTTEGTHLAALGINALELLPPADSAHDRAWGYGTSHFLAPDHDLGFPTGHDHPTSNRDLSDLVRACHKQGVRFLIDVVTAFGKDEAYSHAGFPDFYIGDAELLPDEDVDKWTSVRGFGRREVRDGFGSNLFRHSSEIEGYDPAAGTVGRVHPSRALMSVALDRWMRDFGVDGIRMDSIENVASWDFVGEYRNRAHARFEERVGDANDRFLVIGEEISMPMDLLHQGRVDALWNDPFRARVRSAILGEGYEGRSFETTVREMIDCRRLGFREGTQAVNYVTSHDVEGFRRERLFNFLCDEGLDVEATGRRIRLAFACLLTAVGIPMILAGEEFADQHDRFDADGNVSQGGGKQVDPVDFGRLHNLWSPLQPMRREVFDFVSRLVRLRTSHPALASDEVEFLHVDFLPGRRILAWRRGPVSDPVVVVANFSDFESEGEYVVPNWPETRLGRTWRDVSQDREVDPAWVGREAIFPWEAKVYALV